MMKFIIFIEWYMHNLTQKQDLARTYTQNYTF